MARRSRVFGLVLRAGCAALSGAALAIPGCSSPPATTTQASEDFRLDLVVYARVPGGTGAYPSVDPLFEPARLILEPGGVLRAAYGHGVDAQIHPPLARTLTRDQAIEVATLTRALLESSPHASTDTTNTADSADTADTAAQRRSLTPSDAAAVLTSDDLIPAAAVAGNGARRVVLVLSAVIDGRPRYVALEQDALDTARPLLEALADLTWRPR